MHGYESGQCYYIRKQKYHVLGRVADQTLTHLVLADASWVADEHRRLGEFIAAGISEQTEIEFVGRLLVPIVAIDDAIVWTHDLPLKSQ